MASERKSLHEYYNKQKLQTNDAMRFKKLRQNVPTSIPKQPKSLNIFSRRPPEWGSKIT